MSSIIATTSSGPKISARLPERRHDGGSIVAPEPVRTAAFWPAALPGLRLAHGLLLGAQLGRVDLDLVALVVDVDVLVLVPPRLLVAAPLLLGRHGCLA